MVHRDSVHIREADAASYSLGVPALGVDGFEASNVLSIKKLSRLHPILAVRSFSNPCPVISALSNFSRGLDKLSKETATLAARALDDRLGKSALVGTNTGTPLICASTAT